MVNAVALCDSKRRQLCSLEIYMRNTLEENSGLLDLLDCLEESPPSRKEGYGGKIQDMLSINNVPLHGPGIYFSLSSINLQAVHTAIVLRHLGGAVVKRAGGNRSKARMFGRHQLEVMAIMGLTHGGRLPSGSLLNSVISIGAVLKFSGFLGVHPIQLLNSPNIKVWPGVVGCQILTVHITGLLRKRWIG